MTKDAPKLINAMPITTNSATGFAVKVSPTAMLSMLDHHLRRSPETATSAIGIMLGTRSSADPSILEVNSTFALPPAQEEDETESSILDKEFFKQMMELNTFRSQHNIVIGWYFTSTNSSLTDAEQCFKLNEMISLQIPIFPLVLIHLNPESMRIEAFIDAPIQSAADGESLGGSPVVVSGASNGTIDRIGTILHPIPVEVYINSDDTIMKSALQFSSSCPELKALELPTANQAQAISSLEQVEKYLKEAKMFADHMADSNDNATVKHMEIGQLLMDTVCASPTLFESDVDSVCRSVDRRNAEFAMASNVANIIKSQIDISQIMILGGKGR